MRDESQICVHCFDGTISDSVCGTCGKETQIKDGIPSFVSTSGSNKTDGKLRILASAGKDDLDDILSQIRGDYMDGTIVDRFFKTRTASWRVLVSSDLAGRGLVVGSHEEKVGILLSEVLEKTYTVDTNLTRLRAQSAVAEAMGTTVEPIHSNLESLPFPSESFDVIAVDCRAAKIEKYLSEIEKFLVEDGTVLLLVDGWPRELGMTELVGLGRTPEGALERIRSSMHGHPFGISRTLKKAGFTVTDQYALISTNRHENQRAFNVQSKTALDWLLHGSDKTASTISFNIARHLSRLARKGGMLRQCYPRYLFSCKRSSGFNQSDNLTDSIMIAGKNRSVVLGFDDGAVDTIRKIPNSRWQVELNNKAQTATDAVSGSVSSTIPKSELRQTAFGPELYEHPVSGTPLDQSLERTPESVEKHIRIVFDWLIEFQQTNTIQWIEKNPEEIERDLTVEGLGLSDPPKVKYSVEIPQVITHGDLFGSNIYITEEEVTSVIDWEWAEQAGNPIIDPGFFLLQLAANVGKDFADGFRKLFIENNSWKDIVYKYILKYCKDMKINTTVFMLYLSQSYISRIRKDITFNKRLDIDYPARVQDIWRQYEITTTHLSELS